MALALLRGYLVEVDALVMIRLLARVAAVRLGMRA
jgi:hypothetical protein